MSSSSPVILTEAFLTKPCILLFLPRPPPLCSCLCQQRLARKRPIKHTLPFPQLCFPFFGGAGMDQGLAHVRHQLHPASSPYLHVSLGLRSQHVDRSHLWKAQTPHHRKLGDLDMIPGFLFVGCVTWLPPEPTRAVRNERKRRESAGTALSVHHRGPERWFPPLIKKKNHITE